MTGRSPDGVQFRLRRLGHGRIGRLRVGAITPGPCRTWWSEAEDFALRDALLAGRIPSTLTDLLPGRTKLAIQTRASRLQQIGIGPIALTDRLKLRAATRVRVALPRSRRDS